MSQEIAHRAGSADDVKILRRIQGVKRKTSITRPRWYRPSYFGSLRDTVSESRCGRRALSKDFLTSVRFASRREYANEMAAVDGHDQQLIERVRDSGKLMRNLKQDHRR